MTAIPPPGPERDRLVAEAMGWKSIPDSPYLQPRQEGWILPGKTMALHKPRPWSTDDATFVREVLPWLRSKNPKFAFRITVGDYVVFDGVGLANGIYGVGDTIADAGTAFLLKCKEAGLV